MCSLRQDGQDVGDGPFLIGAALEGELDPELRLASLHQLQTVEGLCVLDGATLQTTQTHSKHPTRYKHCINIISTILKTHVHR